MCSQYVPSHFVQHSLDGMCLATSCNTPQTAGALPMETSMRGHLSRIRHYRHLDHMTGHMSGLSSICFSPENIVVHPREHGQNNACLLQSSVNGSVVAQWHTGSTRQHIVPVSQQMAARVMLVHVVLHMHNLPASCMLPRKGQVEPMCFLMTEAMQGVDKADAG